MDRNGYIVVNEYINDDDKIRLEQFSKLLIAVINNDISNSFNLEKKDE